MRLKLKMKVLSLYGSQTSFALACKKRDDWLSKIIRGRRDPSEADKKNILENLGLNFEGDLFENINRACIIKK